MKKPEPTSSNKVNDEAFHLKFAKLVAALRCRDIRMRRGNKSDINYAIPLGRQSKTLEYSIPLGTILHQPRPSTLDDVSLAESPLARVQEHRPLRRSFNTT